MTRSSHVSHTSKSSHLFLVLQLLLLLIVPTSGVTVVVNVPANDEECYLMRFPFHSTIDGNYNVLENHLSSEQVSVVMMDGGGKVLYRSKYGRDHGSFQIKQAETRKLTICAQNNIAKAKRRRNLDDQPRNIGLSINVELPSSEHFDEKTEGLMEYSRAVYTAVSDLTHHFSFRKTRETKHREIVELIFSELLWWTLGQAVFVVLVALLQVMYLRHTVSKTIL